MRTRIRIPSLLQTKALLLSSSAASQLGSSLLRQHHAPSYATASKASASSPPHRPSSTTDSFLEFDFAGETLDNSSTTTSIGINSIGASGSHGAARVSKEVATLFRRLDIGPPSELRPLRGSKGDAHRHGVRITTASRHLYSWTHFRYLDAGTRHPLQAMSMARYRARAAADEPLWCFAMASSAAAVVRRSAEKRVRGAFRQALEASGYDRFGRRVKAPTPTHPVGGQDAGKKATRKKKGKDGGGDMREPDELYGTVFFWVSNPKTLLQVSPSVLHTHLTEFLSKYMNPTLGRKRNADGRRN